MRKAGGSRSTLTPPRASPLSSQGLMRSNLSVPLYPFLYSCTADRTGVSWKAGDQPGGKLPGRDFGVVPRTFIDMEPGGSRLEKQLLRMAEGTEAPPGRGVTSLPAELAAMRAAIAEEYRISLGRVVPTPPYPPPSEKKGPAKGRSTKASGDENGKEAGQPPTTQENVRRRSKTKAIKEGDLRKHYETLADVPTRDGSGYGSAMRPKFAPKARESGEVGGDAGAPGVERPAGLSLATSHKPGGIMQRISSMSFLQSDEEPEGKGPADGSAKAAHLTGEMEEAEAAALAAWERDNAYDIAQSPVNPGSELSEGSEDYDIHWKRECLARAEAPYGYVPEDSAGNYNSDGSLDSVNPWI